MKKRIHLGFFILLFITSLQVNSQKINYKKEAVKENSNFFEIVNNTRKQFSDSKYQAKGIESRKDLKARKQFERWVWMWKDKVNPDGTFPTEKINGKEYLELLTSKTNLKAKIASSTKSWVQIGPTEKVVENGYTGYPGMGRVNVVAVDANNTQIMYVGSAAGGLWKTSDGGSNWLPKTDSFAGLGVTDIIIDPNNSNIIYMATGDEDAEHISSIGLFKSIDAGETWAATGLTFSLSENEYIRDLSFAPGSSSVIFALTNSKIKKSTDSGATFTDMVSNPVYGSENFQTIVFDPNDATKVVVSDKFGGLWYSSDSGSNFTEHSVLQGATESKLKLTASANDNDFFYGITQDGKFKKFRFDNDDTGADLVSETTITGYNSQGGYNMCLAVSPTDKNKIIVAGVNGYRSLDNGVTFSMYLNAYNEPEGVGFYVHADHHHLSFLADGITVINGHDAGVHKGSINLTTGWVDLSDGLVISQPYNIAITQGINGDDYMMALQDNDGFSKVYKDDGQKWVACLAGDGTSTGIDINDSNIRYLGGTNGNLNRTDDGYSSSYDSAIEILPSASGSAAFISPLALHPTNASIIYAGHGDVKKSTNKGGDGTNVSGDWTALNSGLTETEFLDVSLYNGSSQVRIFAIGYLGENKTLRKSVDDGANWVTVTNPTGVVINSVYAVPNTEIVYATVSSYSAGKKVYKSTDNGVNWTNISGDLPNIIMYKMILDTNKTNETLYLGTELGMYFTDNSTTNWTKLGTDLPNVRISDIKISENNGNVYIGTFGRGMWMYDDQKYFDNVTDNNWSVTTNWEGKTLPTVTDDVYLKGSENVTLNTNATNIKSLEIADGALLTIEKNKDLTIENNFYSTSSNKVVKINSDENDSGVLIIKGTSTGKIEFERGGLKLNKWSLISVPVEGQKIVEFADLEANDIRLNETPDPDRYAIADYNDANGVGNKWVYYDYDTNVNETFTKTKGYIISRGSDGSVSFVGTLLTNNQPVLVSANQWNAIGNPYAAYYPANKNSNVSFINDNSTNLESQAVYIWDVTQEKYVALTELAPSDVKGIPPGQGFFVKTKTGVSSLTFNENKRMVKPVSGNNTFNKKVNSTPYLTLFAKSANIQVSTDVIYSETATLGFDVNEDILNFDSSSFDITTQLLANNIGKNFTMQSIPNNDFENQIIPINLIVEANKDVEFKAATFNLPEDISVYLEDKTTKSMYKLSEEESLKITIKENLSNIGRFYLHLSRSSLTVDSLNDNSVKLFNDNNNIHVNGLTDQNIKIQLFDISGKQIFISEQKGNGKNSFLISNINTGVYLVKASFSKKSITKKIIIK